EVQKGNAPEERKLQRLFRNGEACRMIKRCNDFGAGGVSVAIGELADGLDIDLDKVPRKYEGLDGTELAISESQERMAVVVEAENVSRFLAIAESENLQACPVAVVKADPRLTMKWNGNVIVDVSREFLGSNGAPKHISIETKAPALKNREFGDDFAQNLLSMAGDLNICSKRGLSERFDSTIGAGTVLMPFGGKYQLTPAQAMVQKISVEQGHTDDVSMMAWGYNPFLTEMSPYHGAYSAVVESVCKLIASGAEFKDVYLTFQEYFAHPGRDGKRWGQPLCALLGAFEAQKNLGIGAIGGKDSMSGTFEKLDVPPTLVSFAVTTGKVKDVVSGDFKKPGSRVYMLEAEKDENGLPETASLLKNFDAVTKLVRSGKALSVYAPVFGGIAEAVMKMAIGNGFGFAFDGSLSQNDIFSPRCGCFLVETDGEIENAAFIGTVTKGNVFTCGNASVSGEKLLSVYEGKLENVYACNIAQGRGGMETFSYKAEKRTAPAIKVARPKVL
ncbi:MAG: AIR synthase-related protein, partial [Clostridia bacterium]|nr:AIR synthase-related protein [Clostridia bacterium]